MQIKDDVVLFLEKKQLQLMEKYAVLEDIQGGYPVFYSLCQMEMDRLDLRAELIRRKICELEGLRQGDYYAGGNREEA